MGRPREYSQVSVFCKKCRKVFSLVDGKNVKQTIAVN